MKGRERRGGRGVGVSGKGGGGKCLSTHCLTDFLPGSASSSTVFEKSVAGRDGSLGPKNELMAFCFDLTTRLIAGVPAGDEDAVLPSPFLTEVAAAAAEATPPTAEAAAALPAFPALRSVLVSTLAGLWGVTLEA